MRSQRLIHDTAYALACHICSVFENLLRPEERRDAFSECYDAAKAALEAFCIHQAREDKRLCRPSNN
jgi:hypothetical protein